MKTSAVFALLAAFASAELLKSGYSVSSAYPVDFQLHSADANAVGRSTLSTPTWSAAPTVTLTMPAWLECLAWTLRPPLPRPARQPQGHPKNMMRRGAQLMSARCMMLLGALPMSPKRAALPPPPVPLQQQVLQPIHQLHSLLLLVHMPVLHPKESSQQPIRARLSPVRLLVACSDLSLLLPLPLPSRQREHKGILPSNSLCDGTVGYNGQDSGYLIMGFTNQEIRVRNRTTTDLGYEISNYLGFLISRISSFLIYAISTSRRYAWIVIKYSRESCSALRCNALPSRCTRRELWNGDENILLERCEASPAPYPWS
jgi:hypothetical protein